MTAKNTTFIYTEHTLSASHDNEIIKLYSNVIYDIQVILESILNCAVFLILILF